MALEKWNFDLAHSSVGFWVRHLMISKVHGRFTRWTGEIAFDDVYVGTGGPNSPLTAVPEPASLMLLGSGLLGLGGVLRRRLA